MNILLASSEVYPFARTGGLGDVCGALPGALASLGHDVAVILPAYRSALCGGQAIEPVGVEFIVPIGSKMVGGRLLQSKLPHTDVPVYLIEQDEYFDRDELYGGKEGPYPDNCERFVFFSRAVLEAIRLLDLDVDIIHSNDWQTGLIPALLSIEYSANPRYEKIATLHTVHNISYQGDFWHWDMLLTGLDWKYFNWHEMEFHGKLNFLKTALVFSDAISTVSPRYAEEIQTYEFAYGLEGILQFRRDSLRGILNGIDTHKWDPSADKEIAAKYDANTFTQAKPQCKQALQQEFGLPPLAEVPLVGFIGRLAPQKGHQLIIDAIEHNPDLNVQWVILGTGDEDAEKAMRELASRHRGKVAVRIDFCEATSRKIYAGTDLLAMPSLYEPCGLCQLYALRYGSVPVARMTGGLANTVDDRNGFPFSEFSAMALAETLREARDEYVNDRASFNERVEAGMRQDWSWEHSAAEYAEFYQQIAARKCREVGV